MFAFMVIEERAVPVVTGLVLASILVSLVRTWLRPRPNRHGRENPWGG